MKLRRIFTALIASAMIFSLNGIFGVSAEKANTNDIVILYTNDVHCAIDQNIGYDGLMLYKREMQEKHKNVLLVDAGDAIQGMVTGTVSDGAYIIRLMNMVGYDAAVLGNHEFDYGIDVLTERAKELNCGYICSNFQDLNGNTIFPPYKIVESGENKIAFVGVTTPNTLISTSPALFKNDKGEYLYSFGDNDEFYEHIQKAVDSARKDGADYVILLAHVGENIVPQKWGAEEIIKNLSGIDAFIDGHSHEVTPGITVKSKDNKDVLITQTGTKFANIGKMTIEEDGDITTELISNVPKPDDDSSIPSDSWIEPADREFQYVDKEINEEIKAIQAEIDKSLDKKVGSTSFELYDTDPDTGLRRVRNGETNLGDLCADSYRYVLGADIGITNGGSIRTSIKAGDITGKNILDSIPFDNMASTAEVTG